MSEIPGASLSADVLQASLAAIVTSSDDAIVSKDLNGIVKSWNKSAERIFGYTSDEMIGQSITKLLPPENLKEEDYILSQLRKGQRVDHFRTIRMRKDGKRILVSVTISPIHDGKGNIVGASKVARDLSQAAELEGMYGAIVASSDDAIVGKDLNGIVRSWNKSAERIFGYTVDEMIGQPITKIIPPDRLEEEPKILARLARGERVDHFETVRIHKDGHLIDVSVTISPIRDASGTVIGASKIARDITALKGFMREREQLLASEQAARREAERTSRVKDEFLATLSHELRTPLNAVLGWSQLLRTSKMDEQDMQEGLDSIERNARLQTQLIDELLDMSRIMSGKMRLDVQRVAPEVVVNNAIEAMRPAADAKGIRIHKIIDPNAGPVQGDPNRLQQVVWNLVSNAIKFTPKGGRIQVFVQRVNSHIEITVTDNGLGIKPEFLPHLFSKFTQADSSSTRAHGGLGLGLAIVRHLVEMHGGSVRASSQGEGLGATFVVGLPVSSVLHNDPKDTEQKYEPSDLAAPMSVDLSGVKVLVVDDDPDSAALVQRLLEQNKAAVITASSAAEALDLLKKKHPDILISDIGMPREDGYQLLQRVRNLTVAEGSEIPSVALTAFARSEDRRRAMAAGFQMHLPKPIEAAELLAVVANLTQTARRRAGRS